MVKLIGPLHSVSASGKLKKTLIYYCGERLRMLNRFLNSEKRERDEYLNETQSDEVKNAIEDFKEGAKEWQKLGLGKGMWRDVWIMVRTQLTCDAVELMYVTGYNFFMSFYLRYGKNGWENYPYPPPELIKKKSK